mgnify:CR=1 FL=1
MKKSLFLLLTVVVWLSSCGRQTARQQEQGDTVRFRYAKRITVVRYGGYTEVTLANPWKTGKVLHRYLLVPRGETPDGMPAGTVVHGARWYLPPSIVPCCRCFIRSNTLPVWLT